MLRPGGRVAVAVWAARERNPWLGRRVRRGERPDRRAGAAAGRPRAVLARAIADRLAALLAGAGLDDVTVGELPVPARAASFEEWWARTVALAGPLAKVLRSLPAPAADALRARVRAGVRDYETPDGLELPGVTLLASARTSTAS